jgi:hypothetical protein
VLGDQRHDGRAGEQRPVPSVGTPQTVSPGWGAGGSAAAAQPVQSVARPAQGPAKPGFSF